MINGKPNFIVLFLLSFIWAPSFSQLPSSLFRKIEIKIDTAHFDSYTHVIEYNRENHLYFVYDDYNPTCEVRLYLNKPDMGNRIRLLGSNDYDLIDTLININNDHIRFKVRFRNLEEADFLNFTFAEKAENSLDSVIHIIPLLPTTHTSIDFRPSNNELFVGETKDYELLTNRATNIRINNLWKEDGAVNYRVTNDNGRIIISLLSQELGHQVLNLQLQTKTPYISDSGTINFNLPMIEEVFEVKASRLKFLRIDQEEVILDSDNLAGYEIQLDNNPYLKLEHTYRIENQEDPGGPLYAEIFTRRYLNNGKILCSLRPYSYHSQSEGYLYIKENDVARFITNFDIIPKTNIKSVKILREGSDWTDNLNVYPGETIEVQILGESLHKANFVFDGITKLSSDTLLNNQNISSFMLKVPLNIYNKSVPIYNNDSYTGIDLKVTEFQRPREFDFIYVEGNGFKRELATMSNTIFADNLIQDISLQFDRDKIDSEGRLYGQQHLNIKITLRGKNNELIELKDIEDIVICPGEFSPRSSFYGTNCTAGILMINNYLSKKTYDLEEWSRIIIEISHDKSKHGGNGYSKTLEIILQKYWRFDIDVSFPAGLLTFGKESSGALTGISLAMIAQFSFYEKNKINRFKPYKVGFGFIALDAFNFSENSDNRDIALVVLGSLYPTRKDKKLTFPLYFGGGYKLKQEEFFFLIGPGIRVSL